MRNTHTALPNLISPVFLCALLATFLLGAISACTPSATDPTKIEISDLVGLWNSSENKAGKSDVSYTRISSDGSIIEYDYDGDEVDAGLDCYHIISGSLKKLEANRFQVTADMYENTQFDVELELLDAGYALKIYFMDAEAPLKILKSQIWTRVANNKLLDNEPSCVQ